MACNQNLSTSICKQYVMGINCLQNMYEGSSYDVILQIYNTDGTYLNLDLINKIHIGVYDIRKKVLVTYNNPLDIIDTSIPETYISVDMNSNPLYRDDSLNDLNFNNISVMYPNNEIIILQYNYLLESSFTNNESINLAYENIGKIKFNLSKDMTKVFVVGNLYVDVKLEKNDGTDIIISAFKIGYISNYKLNFI